MRPGGNPMLKARGERIAFRNTRHVWALLSAGEVQTARLIDVSGLNRQTVYRALHRLKDAGYIHWEHDYIRVVVPFIVRDLSTPPLRGGERAG